MVYTVHLAISPPALPPHLILQAIFLTPLSHSRGFPGPDGKSWDSHQCHCLLEQSAIKQTGHHSVAHTCPLGIIASACLL